jgi:hypothetical protein
MLLQLFFCFYITFLKLRNLYHAGAFGQGGSTALAYSEITLIASRKYYRDKKTTEVAFTVVMFDPGDVNVDKHGYYKYLVDANTGCPFRFSINDDEEFSEGTLVRHISMDLSKYYQRMTQPTGSLWHLAHLYLWDPVLPFSIEENRSEFIKDSKTERRTVAGNTRRLISGQYTEYYNSANVTFKNSKVTIHWWVLKMEGDKPQDRIKNYTVVSKPIVVTFNGQKQGDFPNTVIKNDIKLPYIDKYLVVQVDCDTLDAESRRHLFPTTRESVRDTEIGDDLRRLITEILLGDSELKRLDQDRKKALVLNVDKTSSESLKKRLASRVKQHTSSGGPGKSGCGWRDARLCSVTHLVACNAFGDARSRC